MSGSVQLCSTTCGGTTAATAAQTSRRLFLELTLRQASPPLKLLVSACFGVDLDLAAVPACALPLIPAAITSLLLAESQADS